MSHLLLCSMSYQTRFKYQKKFLSIDEKHDFNIKNLEDRTKQKENHVCRHTHFFLSYVFHCTHSRTLVEIHKPLNVAPEQHLSKELQDFYTRLWLQSSFKFSSELRRDWLFPTKETLRTRSPVLRHQLE